MTARPSDTYEQPSRWERAALASGIVFAVLQIVAIVFVTVFLLSQLPPVGTPLPEWAEALVQIPTMTANIANYLCKKECPVPLAHSRIGARVPLDSGLRSQDAGTPPPLDCEHVADI